MFDWLKFKINLGMFALGNWKWSASSNLLSIPMLWPEALGLIVRCWGPVHLGAMAQRWLSLLLGGHCSNTIAMMSPFISRTLRVKDFYISK